MHRHPDKRRTKTPDPADRAELRKRYGMLCSAAGIAVNLLISAAKFFAGWISRSVAVTADAVNNLTDAGGAIVSLAGFKLADKKADAGHPFGHGRLEYIAGIGVSFFTLLTGAELLRTSAGKTIHPEKPEAGVAAAAIILFSIGVKCLMAVITKSAGKKIASPALEATARDSLADALSSTAVLLSLIFARLFPHAGFPFDGAAGILIALFILYNGFASLKETVNPLLGRPADPEFVKNIESIVLQHKPISGIHDLVIHDYGPGRVMLSLHAEVPEKSTLSAIHKVIDTAENDIMIRTGCAAVIHMDPIDLENQEFIRVRGTLSGILADMHSGLQFHDLQMVPEKNHINLVFDLVRTDGENRNGQPDDSGLRKNIDSAVKKKLGERFRCVIRIEAPFTAGGLPETDPASPDRRRKPGTARKRKA